MSLVEAIVTLALLSIVLLALAPLFTQSVNINASSNQTSIANSLAREKLEQLRLLENGIPMLTALDIVKNIVGNVLIAVGAILPAFGGTFSRMGFSGALYVSEFLGALLLFAGFIRATTPMRETPSDS